jgi:hypothetical protein
MIDIYVCSSDIALLQGFCASLKGVIGPRPGIPAFDEIVDEFCGVIPAREAVGDPKKVYACLRTENEVELPVGIETASNDVGVRILGAWA